jgi:hypothetical protein
MFEKSDEPFFTDDEKIDIEDGVFFMSDKIYKGEKLIGSSSTQIKRLLIEI